MIGVDGPIVSRVNDARIGIGAIDAAERKNGRNALGREEFTAGKHAHKGRVSVGGLEIALAVEAAQHAGWIALAHLLLNAQTLVALMEVLRHQVDGGAARRFDPDRAAQAVGITVIEPRVVEGVLGVTIAVQVEPGHTHCRHFTQRHVDHALGFDVVVVAVFNFSAGRHARQAGTGRTHVDHARGGVAAEQGSLRSAQHFDLGQIVEFAFKQTGAGERRVVQVDCGGGIAAHPDAEIADPANGEARPVKVRAGEGHVGQGQLQIRRVLDLLLFKRFAVEGANRDRNVLQPLVRALCGHDNFGIRNFFFGCSCILCICWKRDCPGAYASKQGQFTPH